MPNQVPPHDLALEASVLNAAILDREALDEIAAVIAPGDFYHEGNRLVWVAIVALMGASEPVDLVTVKGRLEAQGKLQAAGGSERLLKLTEQVPLVAHASGHAKRLRDLSLVRLMIHAGLRIAGTGYSLPEDLDRYIDESVGAIVGVSDHRIGDDQWESLGDVSARIYDETQKASESGRDWLGGVRTGFHRLDRFTYGMEDGALWVLAARPGMGKTALALQIAYQVAQAEGVTAFFSLEMNRDQLAKRLAGSIGRVSPVALRWHRLEAKDWTALATHTEHSRRVPLWFFDRPQVTPTMLRAQCRRLERKQGRIRLIVVDYLQLMNSDRRHDNRASEVEEISREAKLIAKDFGCPVLMLSQLNRDLEKRPDKRPILADLRNSGAIEQDADLVLFVYREAKYKETQQNANKAELLVAKSRNGATGWVELEFHGPEMRFANLEEHSQDDFRD